MPDDGVSVDPEQIRAHAAHVDEVAARFEAVKAASAHIVQDNSAYGLLCGWIAGILEGRHVNQAELIAQAEENLSLVAQRLRDTADDYEAADAATAAPIETVHRELA